MRRNIIQLITASAVLLLVPSAIAYPVPMPGTEPIPELVAKADLVCKGEVVAGMEGLQTTHLPGVAIAKVLVDRCFKGSVPGAQIIDVQIDTDDGSARAVFKLYRGDYRLLFLERDGDSFKTADVFFGSIAVSRLSPAATDTSDPLHALEFDFKAGLKDSDPELVLDSIRMLGNLRHLLSNSEVEQFGRSENELIRLTAWQALLRAGDLSQFDEIAAFLLLQPERRREFFMPRDRVFELRYELQNAVSFVRDPAMLGNLEKLSSAPDRFLRSSALQALRGINSPHSASAYLTELGDVDCDNAFSAMQGLLSLDTSDRKEWVPTWPEFCKAPQSYAARTKRWWLSRPSF